MFAFPRGELFKHILLTTISITLNDLICWFMELYNTYFVHDSIESKRPILHVIHTVT